MPTRRPVTVIDVATAVGHGEIGPYPFEQFSVQALAQGDSWFSIGALPPGKTSNLLLELKTARSTVVVQCARPGKVLRLFTDTTREQNFLNMLLGPLARRWSVILISGVGNDIIAAVGSDPSEPAERRLLRTPAERGAAGTSPSDFVSQPGWDTFVTHMRQVFNDLVDLRDQGINRHVPMVMHNYARMVPRPSGAGLGTGPWLHPAFDAYAVPPDQREAVADELLGRMVGLIGQLIAERRAQDPDCALYLVDSMGLAGVTPAAPGSSGTSGDWVNEIHLTRGGYRKCVVVWADVLDALPA